MTDEYLNDDIECYVLATDSGSGTLPLNKVLSGWTAVDTDDKNEQSLLCG
jgi:hypothetical protein